MTSYLKNITGFHLDYTQFSVVTICLHPACQWRAATSNRLAAWKLAAQHEQQVHPEQKYARQALNKASHFRESTARV